MEGQVRGLGMGPEATGCGGVAGLALTWPLSSDPRGTDAGRPCLTHSLQERPSPAACMRGPPWLCRKVLRAVPHDHEAGFHQNIC